MAQRQTCKHAYGVVNQRFWCCKCGCDGGTLPLVGQIWGDKRNPEHLVEIVSAATEYCGRRVRSVSTWDAGECRPYVVMTFSGLADNYRLLYDPSQ